MMLAHPPVTSTDEATASAVSKSAALRTPGAKAKEGLSMVEWAASSLRKVLAYMDTTFRLTQHGEGSWKVGGDRWAKPDPRRANGVSGYNMGCKSLPNRVEHYHTPRMLVNCVRACDRALERMHGTPREPLLHAFHSRYNSDVSWEQNLQPTKPTQVQPTIMVNDRKGLLAMIQKSAEEAIAEAERNGEMTPAKAMAALQAASVVEEEEQAVQAARRALATSPATARRADTEAATSVPKSVASIAKPRSTEAKAWLDLADADDRKGPIDHETLTHAMKSGAGQGASADLGDAAPTRVSSAGPPAPLTSESDMTAIGQAVANEAIGKAIEATAPAAAAMAPAAAAAKTAAAAPANGGGKKKKSGKKK